MAEPLRPKFFVTRQNGNMVPLIAMDELPPTFNIRGVSRVMTAYDIFGMTGVGTFDARHRTHVVENISGGLSKTANGNTTDGDKPKLALGFEIDGGNKTDRSLMDSMYAHADRDSSKRASVNRTSGIPSLPKAYGIEEQLPAAATCTNFTSAAFRVDRNANRPAALPVWHGDMLPLLGGAPGVKVYCSYWLRRGECDYAQQGCLYLHEMPLELDCLKELGLRDIPQWYREKHGLRSLLAAGNGPSFGPGDKHTKMGRSWRVTGNVEELLVDDDKPEGSTSVQSGIYAGEKRGGMPTFSKAINTVHFPPPMQQSNGFKHNGDRLMQQHSKSAMQHARAPAPTTATARKPVQGPPEPPKETVREKQMRATIAALDAHEKREREREALAENYAVLIPEKLSQTSPSSASQTVVTPTSSQDDDVEDVVATKATDTVLEGASIKFAETERKGDTENAKGGERAVKAETPTEAEAPAQVVTPSPRIIKTPKRPIKQMRKKISGRHNSGAFKGTPTPSPSPRAPKAVGVLT